MKQTGRALEAEDDRLSQVPCVWQGRVAELARQLQRPEFLRECALRYRNAGFGEVGDSEYRSWRFSWPALIDVLLRAGLEQMQIYLEYSAAGGASRFDALLLADAPDGAPALTVIELKQWTDVEVLSPELVRRSDGLEMTHPAVQVSGYLAFLRNWFEAGTGAVQIRGVVFLHNATRAQVEPLHVTCNKHCRDIPILSGEDLTLEMSAEQLVGALQMTDLQPPGEQRITAFARTRWTPSQRLLDNVGTMLQGNRSFVLFGDQQDALLRIQRAIDLIAGHESAGSVVVVTGGPGSGKTVIAARLLALNLRRESARRHLDVRYATPSGTLIAQMRRSVPPAAKNLFVFPGDLLNLGHPEGKTPLAIVDEAQRLRRPSPKETQLEKLIKKHQILVLFLDERQIVRPQEGVTIAQVEQFAAAYGRKVQKISLAGSFRSNGSRAYMTWVDQLLYETPQPWTGDDFDLALVSDPAHMQAWIEEHHAKGARARMTAGFCWPWERHGQRLLPEVAITWTRADGTEQSWKAPWNARERINDAGTIAPARNFWATDPGGHKQVGCIYTAQGMEYDYGGVIIGPDLVRRNGSWHADPRLSHDNAMRGKDLTPERYLPLALNTYRVLLTRSNRATRIYSTDPETQRFLSTLVATRH
ncbi:DNA/RNA helicase domain-containing protein [Actinomadura macrotermitis]|uniref:RecBCD enzyme subunit RecD n=1 Tax=Actinomadura macrotermitis TaxID=2585200 RepID=A0A7K0C0A8_9ACTN|nr:DNA/RNA helicase domain-containing protein [Actinomadura macrotermitis]MQY06522.1 RecBCD enzyme subunit RecD [Actinomadura macrotermitis]